MPVRAPIARVALTGAVVCTGDAVLEGHAVLIEGERIARIVAADAVGSDVETVELGGAYVAPGLVDLQVNGGGDVLLNDDPTPGGVAAIVAAHRRLGSTSVMPTVVTSDERTLRAAIDAVRAGLRDGVDGLIGLHVEGPFLNPAKPGIHDRGRIRSLTGTDVELLTSLDAPTIVTLAPEVVEPALIERLVAGGVHVSAGHSVAGPDELAAAADRGLGLVTHLFNAMSGMSAREPGLVGAALADDRLACGLIADGHHVADAAIGVALRSKPPGRLFLVSDAMPPVGGTRATFRLGDADIAVEAGRCVGPGGVLAGSAAALADGVRHVAGLGVPVPDALRMASTAPADALGLGARVGRIADGRTADLVIADADGRITRVMAAGRFLQPVRQHAGLGRNDLQE